MIATEPGVIEPEQPCPTCGAPLRDEHGGGDGSTNEPVALWQCENQHWWAQSAGFGWMPIDPGNIAAETASITVEEA